MLFESDGEMRPLQPDKREPPKHDELVSRRMEQGKRVDVRSVCQGDVLTTTAIQMRWQHLAGGGVSVLQATRRLTGFLVLSPRSSVVDYKR